MPNQLPHPLAGVVRYSTPPATSEDLYEQLLHSTPLLSIAEEIAASLEVEESLNRLRTMAWAEWKVVSLLSKKARPDPFVDALTQWSDATPVGGQFCMSEILSEVCGIRFGSKAFERQSPVAGRVLRRLGWRVRSTRIDGFVRRRWEKHIN